MGANAALLFDIPEELTCSLITLTATLAQFVSDIARRLDVRKAGSSQAFLEYYLTARKQSPASKQVAACCWGRAVAYPINRAADANAINCMVGAEQKSDTDKDS